jgi:hypothetical protein
MGDDLDVYDMLQSVLHAPAWKVREALGQPLPEVSADRKRLIADAHLKASAVEEVFRVLEDEDRRMYAHELLYLIVMEVGYDRTEKILQMIRSVHMEQPTDEERSWQKDSKLLALLAVFRGNIKRTARYLAAANVAAAKRGIPLEDRFGPRGSTSENTMVAYLKSLRARRGRKPAEG